MRIHYIYDEYEDAEYTDQDLIPDDRGGDNDKKIADLYTSLHIGSLTHLERKTLEDKGSKTTLKLWLLRKCPGQIPP